MSSNVFKTQSNPFSPHPRITRSNQPPLEVALEILGHHFTDERVKSRTLAGIHNACTLAILSRSKDNLYYQIYNDGLPSFLNQELILQEVLAHINPDKSWLDWMGNFLQQPVREVNKNLKTLVSFGWGISVESSKKLQQFTSDLDRSWSLLQLLDLPRLKLRNIKEYDRLGKIGVGFDSIEEHCDAQSRADFLLKQLSELAYDDWLEEPKKPLEHFSEWWYLETRLNPEQHPLMIAAVEDHLKRLTEEEKTHTTKVAGQSIDFTLTHVVPFALSGLGTWGAIVANSVMLVRKIPSWIKEGSKINQPSAYSLAAKNVRALVLDKEGSAKNRLYEVAQRVHDAYWKSTLKSPALDYLTQIANFFQQSLTLGSLTLKILALAGVFVVGAAIGSTLGIASLIIVGALFLIQMGKLIYDYREEIKLYTLIVTESLGYLTQSMQGGSKVSLEDYRDSITLIHDELQELAALRKLHGVSENALRELGEAFSQWYKEAALDDNDPQVYEEANKIAQAILGRPLSRKHFNKEMLSQELLDRFLYALVEQIAIAPSN